jgi:hypothetical protein
VRSPKRYLKGQRVWTDLGFATIAGQSPHQYPTEERDPNRDVAFPLPVVLENGYVVKYESGPMAEHKRCHVPAHTVVGVVRARVPS